MIQTDKKKIIRAFALYIILVIWIVLFRLNIPEYCGKYRGIVLVPFSDEYFYVSQFAKYVCIIGNVMLFIGVGIYSCLFFKEEKTIKRISFSFIVALLFSLFLEITQYICMIGTSSTTDLIHNSIGALVGITIYEVLKKYVSNKAINSINKYLIYLLNSSH